MIFEQDPGLQIERTTITVAADKPDFQTRARQLVMEYVNKAMEGEDDVLDTFKLEDTYIVWYCKTLQNAKALVSTTISDGRYYEVTYNGDSRETYLDVYQKQENLVYVDAEDMAVSE